MNLALAEIQAEEALLPPPFLMSINTPRLFLSNPTTPHSTLPDGRNCPIDFDRDCALILSKTTVSLTVQLPHRRWRLRHRTVCLRRRCMSWCNANPFPSLTLLSTLLWHAGTLALWPLRDCCCAALCCAVLCCLVVWPLPPYRHTVKVTETPKYPSIPTHTILISPVRNLLATWAKTFALLLHRFMQSARRYMPSRPFNYCFSAACQRTGKTLLPFGPVSTHAMTREWSQDGPYTSVMDP